MSKVLNSIVGAESNLTRSEQGIPDFPGKGLLTALVDVSGSELKRQRELEDSLKQSMVAPLIQKYWTGNLNDDERQAVADQIKSVLGGGKRTKAFLDQMFEVGGQIHGVNKIMGPPPGAAQQAAAGAVQESKADMGQAGAETDVADATQMLPPPPTAGVLAPPPTVAQATQQPAPNVAAGVAPLNSALAKMFPPAFSEEQRIKLQHTNEMEKVKEQNSARMAELQAQIDAGRFDKNSRLTWKVEMEDGKAKNVLYVLGPNGEELKREIKGDAPANWANRFKDGWIMGPGNRPVAVKLHPLTNQIIEGSENPNLIPPSALLPKLSQTEVVMVDNATGEVRLVPKKTVRGVDMSAFEGADQAVGAAGGSTGTGGTPEEEIINYFMKSGPMSREDAVATVAKLPPETLQTLRNQRISLVPPPTSGTTLPGATPPATLPGGSGAGTGGAGGQTGVPPVAPTGPVSITPPQLSQRTVPGVLPTGLFNQSKQREIPVREAYTQLVGAPEFPDMPSMKTFAHIADDPVRREKLAKALRLAWDGLEQQEKSHGSLINLLKLYVGIPAAEVSARVQTMTQGIGEMLKDDPELQDAYNSTMAMFGTAVGMRSLTKASQAQASVATIERELPVIGINSFSSRDVYSKLAKEMLQVHNGAKNTPTFSEQERNYIHDQVDELNRLARGTAISPPPGSPRGGRGAVPGAPGAGSGARPVPPGRIRVRLKGSGRTGTVDASEFDPNTMEKIGGQ